MKVLVGTLSYKGDIYVLTNDTPIAELKKILKKHPELGDKYIQLDDNDSSLPKSNDKAKSKSSKGKSTRKRSTESS